MQIPSPSGIRFPPRRASQVRMGSRPRRTPLPPRPSVIVCVRGVLSPLLSNLVLDELDRELERREHRFVRYADDCIYVRSERAGQRVMESVTRFITQKLKLKVNEAKSAVARPQERKFLGFSFSAGPEVKRVIAPKAQDRFKRRIREITRRAKGVSMKTTIERQTHDYERHGTTTLFAVLDVAAARGVDTNALAANSTPITSNKTFVNLWLCTVCLPRRNSWCQPSSSAKLAP